MVFITSIGCINFMTFRRDRTTNMKIYWLFMQLDAQNSHCHSDVTWQSLYAKFIIYHFNITKKMMNIWSCLFWNSNNVKFETMHTCFYCVHFFKGKKWKLFRENNFSLILVYTAYHNIYFASQTTNAFSFSIIYHLIFFTLEFWRILLILL